MLTADEPATFECSLDGAAFQTCGPTTAFEGLHPGHHSLAARATDTAGNVDPTPAEITVTVTGHGGS